MCLLQRSNTQVTVCNANQKTPWKPTPKKNTNQQNKIRANQPCSETNRINREQFQPYQVSLWIKQTPCCRNTKANILPFCVCTSTGVMQKFKDRTWLTGNFLNYFVLPFILDQLVVTLSLMQIYMWEKMTCTGKNCRINHNQLHSSCIQSDNMEYKIPIGKSEWYLLIMLL